MGVGDNYPFRDQFDSVIRCLGFKFDDSIFASSPMANLSTQAHTVTTNPGKMSGRRKKYPNVTPDYQAVNVSGLYFIGVIGHGIDWRESAGNQFVRTKMSLKEGTKTKLQREISQIVCR